MRPMLWTTRTASVGAVSIAARPRPGGWLPDEMRALRDAGIDVLITALTDAETRELGLTDERQPNRQRDVTSHRHTAHGRVLIAETDPPALISSTRLPR